tara:strand:- start:622 stop:981 length:360 start_codon:yes stop_codon:yes gene_type:complete
MALDIAINSGLAERIGNVSLQIGDIAYYAEVTNINNGLSYSDNFTIIGEITSINFTQGVITIENELNVPNIDDFLMFSKNKAANNTSLLGYYAEVKMNNNSEEAAELFSLSSEIAISSK